MIATSTSVLLGLGMAKPEQCDQCGIKYSDMILKRFSKKSNIGFAIELFAYVLLGIYAVTSYYSDLILVLFFCSIIVLVLYHFLSPKEKGFCDTCIDENRAK